MQNIPPSNAVLFQLTTLGASKDTASAENVREGVEGSRQLALQDKVLLLQYQYFFTSAGAATTLPPALLAAISSRETHGHNIVGDKGNGVGLMQIDKRYHAFARGPTGLDPEKNILCGASLIAENLKFFKLSYWKNLWSFADKLRGAVAAYNCGRDNVRTLEGMDIGTTHNDYSADVWERAKALAEFF